MARIKFGAVVVDGSGKLGGHVFSKNRGGNYLRTKTTPVNPQSGQQTRVRGIFASISSGSAGLSEEDRKSWEDRSAEYARTNVFGDLKNPNGKALYQRLNQNLLLAGEPALSVCPPSAPVVGMEVSAVNAAATGDVFTITNDVDLTGYKVILSGTPAVSPGKTFVKNILRNIATFDGAAAGSIDIFNYYNDWFGLFNAGSVIYIAVQTQNANGQKSPKQTFRVVIGA